MRSMKETINWIGWCCLFSQLIDGFQSIRYYGNIFHFRPNWTWIFVHRSSCYWMTISSQTLLTIIWLNMKFKFKFRTWNVITNCKSFELHRISRFSIRVDCISIAIWLSSVDFNQCNPDGPVVSDEAVALVKSIIWMAREKEKERYYIIARCWGGPVWGGEGRGRGSKINWNES